MGEGRLRAVLAGFDPESRIAAGERGGWSGMKRGDFVAGAIGVAIGGGALFMAADFPADVVMKIGPAFFPDMLAGLFLICSAALMVSAALAKTVPGVVEDPPPVRGLSLENGILRAVVTVIAVIAFVVALRPVGFLITSTVFLTAMMGLLGLRKPVLMVAVSLGITAGVYIIFEKLLGLTLPAGILESVLY
jgi:putative tricarboxylic transport membrane protein